MPHTLYLSMAAFALVSSISPGPVNVVALSAGITHGLRAALAYVFGATAGFTLLLVAVGLGLHELLGHLPQLMAVVQWAGILFLLYMALKLAMAGGELSQGSAKQRPAAMQGAVLQWLNPKAWLASIAGMASYAMGGGTMRVFAFAAVYFAICYVSILSWAFAGATLRDYVQSPDRIRLINRILAGLLVVSAAYLAYDYV